MLEPNSSTVGIEARSTSTPIKSEAQEQISFDNQTLVNDAQSPNARMDNLLGESVREEMEKSKKGKKSRKSKMEKLMEDLQVQ